MNSSRFIQIKSNLSAKVNERRAYPATKNIEPYVPQL